MDFLLALNNLAHDIGIALGVGGVTIVYIISRKTEKNPKIASTTMPIIKSISRLILLGLILLIISGIGLMFTVKWEMNKPLLYFKHFLVLIILINGAYIGKLSNKIEKKTANIEKIKRRLKSATGFNLILWYVVTIISVVI